MEERRLLTAKEAAAYLRISLFTLRKIEQQGLVVPYRTPGGHRRYSIDMLNEYLENSRTYPVFVRPAGPSKQYGAQTGAGPA